MKVPVAFLGSNLADDNMNSTQKCEELPETLASLMVCEVKSMNKRFHIVISTMLDARLNVFRC